MNLLREDIRAAFRRAGSRVQFVGSNGLAEAFGEPPATTTVYLDTERSRRALHRADHLALGECFLDGEIRMEGPLSAVFPGVAALDLEPRRWESVLFAIRLLLSGRRRLQRRSIEQHYDRPPDFFTPWLDPLRCYSHGLYASGDETIEVAQERKMQAAIDALGLRAGMHVFDMGAGWGAFMEYAGRRGIHVHGITLSSEQHRFVAELLRKEELPGSIELVDLLDYRPARRFDGAVFMGTFEHLTDYRFAARFLRAHIAPTARLWADFCAQRTSFQSGAFMKRYIWPGTASYVNVPRLVEALIAEGFNVYELSDDSRSYGLTCGAWARRFERAAERLEASFDPRSVRAFRLYLEGSQYFFEHGLTQAYHLVAGLSAAALRPAP